MSDVQTVNVRPVQLVYRYATADEDEVAGLDIAWAASMRTLRKISELVITLSAASSAAFTVPASSVPLRYLGDRACTPHS